MHTDLTVSELWLVHFIVTVNLDESVISSHNQVKDAVTRDVIIIQTEDATVTLVVRNLPSVSRR